MLESAEISKMSVAEQLQAMEQLWDALCRTEADLSSPAWHAEILAERKERAARGESKFLTLDQLKERLRRPKE